MSTLLNTRMINTTIVGIATLILLAFLWSYSETGGPPTINLGQSQNNPSDYFLVNTLSTRFDQQGSLDTIVIGESILHNPKDNSATIKNPQFKIYRDGILSWTVNSQSGIISGKGNRVDLQQHVIISNPDQTTVLKTPQLIIFPEKKLAITNKPVTLQNPNCFTRSTGLKANLLSKRIDLLSQVRGQYEGESYDD
jgi:lipopolysaccharide export system protein LptC